MKRAVLNKLQVDFKNLFMKLLSGNIDEISFRDYVRLLKRSQPAFFLALLRLFDQPSFSRLSVHLNIRHAQLSVWNCGKINMSEATKKNILSIVKKRVKEIKGSDNVKSAQDFNDYQIKQELLMRLYKFHPELNPQSSEIEANEKAQIAPDGEIASQQAFSLSVLVGEESVQISSEASLSFKMVDGNKVKLPSSKLEAFKSMERSLESSSPVIVYDSASNKLNEAGKYVFCIDQNVRVVRDVFLDDNRQYVYEEAGALRPLSENMKSFIVGKVVAIIYM